jgi:hypothetical protein
LISLSSEAPPVHTRFHSLKAASNQLHAGIQLPVVD